MRKVTVEIWGSVFGKDVPVESFSGTKQEIVDHVVSLVPAAVRENATCAKALDQSVWSKEVQWFGSHIVGLRFVAVEA
jgi:hypothetical protein